MGQDDTKTTRDLQWSWLSLKMAVRIKDSIVALLAGNGMGMMIAGLFYRRMNPDRAFNWTLCIFIAGFVAEIVILVETGLTLRRTRRHLREELARLRAEAKASYEVFYPDDPIQVARLMMKFDEVLPK